MRLDLRREPFSRFGSWFSIAWEGPERPGRPFGDGLYLRCHHARAVIEREVCQLAILAGGEVVDPVIEADAVELRLRHGEGRVLICWEGDRTLRIRGEGLGLRLRTRATGAVVAYQEAEDVAVINARQATRRLAVQRLAGNLVLDAPWGVETCRHIQVDLTPGADGVCEAAIDEFWSTWERPAGRASWIGARDATGGDFSHFLGALGRQPRDPGLHEAWERAAYVDWACTVSPCGQLARPSMFMSKHWMDQLWSWDHCFNALALAGAHDALAWDQWQAPFDHQDAFGAIPDGLNDVFKHYNFCKPPVHGWTVRELLARCHRKPGKRRLAEIRSHLERHTRWFLDHRRAPGQRLPHYLHGNDSGWDNSTMFDDGVPLQGPDLAALLVVQTEVLADLAGRLGDEAGAAAWRAESASLLAALLDEQWDGERFVPQRLAGGRRVPVRCDSLIPLIPIFLGQRLPAEVRARLAAGLERLMTPHGLATEHPSSPRYTPDGYWRGPVWAPSTCLAAIGLRDAGFADLAREISRRFCATCAQSGFAENFDALTGRGLRDPAYTWTASVFILLVREFRL